MIDIDKAVNKFGVILPQNECLILANETIEQQQKEIEQLKKDNEWISVDDRLPENINKKSVREPWGSSKSVAVIVDGSAESFEKGYVFRFDDGSIVWRVIGFTNPDVLMWKHLKPPKEQGE